MREHICNLKSPANKLTELIHFMLIKDVLVKSNAFLSTYKFTKTPLFLSYKITYLYAKDILQKVNVFSSPPHSCPF